MVGIGVGLFIQLPGNSNKRILHPTHVVGHQDGVYTADVEDRDLPVESGQDVLIYYERKREFVKQSARIQCVDHFAPEASDAPDAPDVAAATNMDEAGPRLLVSFTTTGDPISAESRQHHRVSTVISGMTVSVGAEPSCRMLDVSSTGLSAVARECYSIGHVLEVSIDHDGSTFAGSACIQSIKELGKERTRYGMHSVDDKASCGNLIKGLQQISMHVQREQLRRFAGTA